MKAGGKGDRGRRHARLRWPRGHPAQGKQDHGNKASRVARGTMRNKQALFLSIAGWQLPLGNKTRMYSVQAVETARVS